MTSGKYNWQPIETLEEKKPALLFGDMKMFVGWKESYDERDDVHYIAVEASTPLSESCAVKVTHWLPLPDPPTID